MRARFLIRRVRIEPDAVIGYAQQHSVLLIRQFQPDFGRACVPPDIGQRFAANAQELSLDRRWAGSWPTGHDQRKLEGSLSRDVLSSLPKRRHEPQSLKRRRPEVPDRFAGLPDLLFHLFAYRAQLMTDATAVRRRDLFDHGAD